MLLVQRFADLALSTLRLGFVDNNEMSLNLEKKGGKKTQNNSHD